MVTAHQLGLLWTSLLIAPLTVAKAQPFEEPGRDKLSEATSIELVDSAALNHLNRAGEYLANQQWDNAVGTLRKVGEQYGDGLVKVEDRSVHGQNQLTVGRYVSIRHYCQLRLAALPPDALRLYREQVDDTARAALEAASRSRDRRALRQVLADFFCSSVGDDALLLLGDLSLEAGDYAAAREAWERMTPVKFQGNFETVPRPVFEKVRQAPGPYASDVTLLDEWYRTRRIAADPAKDNYVLSADKPLPADAERRLSRIWAWHGLIATLKYPDAQVELADVDARLVLASIMEGSADRAGARAGEFCQTPRPGPGLAGRQARASGDRADWTIARKRSLAPRRNGGRLADVRRRSRPQRHPGRRNRRAGQALED